MSRASSKNEKDELNMTFGLKKLVEHLEFYHKLPIELKEGYLKMLHDYEKYDGFFEIFVKFDRQKLIKLIKSVNISLFDNHMPHSAILTEFDRYRPIVEYILEDVVDKVMNEINDEINDENDIIGKNNADENIQKENITKKLNKPSKPFIWRENQIKGWQNAIDSDFVNGIHSQATGSGKSLIALKTIWEYHKRNRTHHILWVCERKDIPLKLFFTNKNNLLSFHKNNYAYWKDNDIIDMYKFHIIEHVFNKSKSWVEDINNYNGSKPIFLIVNRAFMTAKAKTQTKNYRYEEIKKMPELVIIDECHSSMACETYQMLLYFKFNRTSKIHGLSATPYRTGKSRTDLKLAIDCEDDLDITTQENEKKLLRVFCKQGNPDQLNLLSFFNLKDAIEGDIVLEPIFHWYKIEPKECTIKNLKKNIKKDTENNTSNKKTIKDIDIKSVLGVLDTIIKMCSYRKCIVWCGETEISDSWKELFDKNKDSYPSLSSLVSYIDHSKIKNNDYDKFYELKDNAILFCANKFREGSDIPYLSSCMFLDKVSNRGTIPFIQCIGRVLRKDDKNLKNNGHILDGCVVEGDGGKIKSIVNKILGYYVYLYNISKSDFIFDDGNPHISTNKIELYNQLSQSFEVQTDKKRIIIKLNNDKKMVIDVTEINLSSLEWKNIIPKFDNALKKMIVLSDHEEYIALQNYCLKLGIKDKYHYGRIYNKYSNLCVFDDDHNKKMLDPEKRFPAYFKDWYDFLKIDTHNFIQSVNMWRKKIKKNNIKTMEAYEKLCENDDSFPSMPEELYKKQGFTNFSSEFGLMKDDTRH